MKRTASQAIYDVLFAAGRPMPSRDIIRAIEEPRSERALLGEIASLVRQGLMLAAPIKRQGHYKEYTLKHGAVRPRNPASLRATINSVETVDKIVADFTNGKTLEELGRAYGRTRERIRQILQKRGVAAKRERTLAELAARVKRLENLMSVSPCSGVENVESVESVAEWIEERLRQ